MRAHALAGAAAVLGSVLMVAGCSGTPTPEPAMSSTASASRYFDGTPEEYAALQRACLEEAGFQTYDDTAGDGFGVDTSVAGTQEFQQAIEACSEQVGEVKTAGLSRAELQERYDARVEQFTCLVENGLVSGEPISFEVFVDEYDRSGQTTLWEPTESAAGLSGQGPTDVCPRTTSW